MRPWVLRRLLWWMLMAEIPQLETEKMAPTGPWRQSA